MNQQLHKSGPKEFFLYNVYDDELWSINPTDDHLDQIIEMLLKNYFRNSEDGLTDAEFDENMLRLSVPKPKLREPFVLSGIGFVSTRMMALMRELGLEVGAHDDEGCHHQLADFGLLEV
jgi:hypothetical protein